MVERGAQQRLENEKEKVGGWTQKGGGMFGRRSDATSRPMSALALATG